MYNLTYGEELQSFPTRKEAVTAAKEISTARNATVVVKTENGREKLTFKRGQLEDYLLELR